MQRSKINDYFSFPQKIDMRPYKVEHLMSPSEKSPEDVFELVGILVHSGTAESGHYFSYIRERPSSNDKANWVEFNDDLVTPWDLNSMEAKCFGGFDLNSANFQIEKQYSAYMLFYQRSSALTSQKLDLERSGIPSPVRLPIAPELSNHIELENEFTIRKYCLYDPSHANFVTKMLSNIKHINNGPCSDQHDLEKHAMFVALNHLDQVVSRAKDIPDFVTSMLPVRQICHSCAECSRDFLDWFCDRPDALRNLLLRNPEPLVRTEMASSILSALVKVKSDAEYAYWTPEDEGSGEEGPQLIYRVVETISRLWDQFHNNTRAWPEYFGLLGSIAKLGDFEAAILLDFGFLRRAVEVVSADANLPLPTQLTRMLNIISKRMNTRPVSYEAVINLLYRLLQVCDWKVQPLRSNERRLEYAENEKDRQPIPLTDVETKHLVQHWVRGHAHILTEKLLQINQNQYATDNILIILLKCEAALDNNIFQAIIQGIRKNTPPLPCGPFLRAAVLYCHNSEMPDAVVRMITYVSKVASTIENTDGREFLQFFKDVINLSPHRQNDPPILRICLEWVPKWAPALLNYWEASVRDSTEKLVYDILLCHNPEPEVEDDETLADHIIIQNLGSACLSHLDEVYIKPRQQAVRVALENIARVIENCAAFFDEDNKDEFLTRSQSKLQYPSVIYIC
jgi:ubiquitin carboxyl-terminal hydrolase 34